MFERLQIQTVASVRLDNVSKTYPGGARAVRGASLEIDDGQMVVLVGPSGCGKSTLLRVIAGLEDVTEGDVWIGGVRVNDMPPAERDIAMVFQNYALYPHMTVRQNLSFGLKMRHVAKDEIARRVAEMAETLSLADLLERKPGQLSGGQRQRVALGRAIVRQPRVFLFDEPLSNLDAKLRVHTRTEFARLHQRLRTTTVYVTHDQTEAMTLGERIIVMDEGVIQQVDKPMNLYHRPANLFVAGFIGSPAMNFFKGRVEAGGFRSGEVVVPLEGRETEAGPTALGNGANGGEVVLGVRPEDFLLDAEAENATEATIELVEPMGHETVVCFRWNGEPAVARTPVERTFRVGEALRVEVRPGGWHLFERKSGRRIG